MESSQNINGCSIGQLRSFQLESGIPAIIEATRRDPANLLDTQEQEKPYQRKDLKEKKESEQVFQEDGKQSFPPQYLYVQPASGKSSSQNWILSI